jgi:hypothetical protein
VRVLGVLGGAVLTIDRCDTLPGMATIHQTTMSPSKLELLTTWLPHRPWYRGSATPKLAKAGGFRLDDPDGEVGVEVIFVADADGTVYQVPMGYRGHPLDGADAWLIGTSEHGVLGRRWIYDGVHDPVVVAQLLALAAGQVHAQAQDVSDTPDQSVRPAPALPRPIAPAEGPSVTDTAAGTSLTLAPAGLSLRVVRVLSDPAPPDGEPVAAVEADVLGVGRRPVLLVRRR